MSETLRPSLPSLRASPGPKQQATLTTPKMPSRSTKRKRNDSEDHKLVVIVNSVKREKSNKPKTTKSDEDHYLDLDRGLNLAFAKLDNRLLADYVATRTKRFFPDLSLVELEDIHISGMLWRQFLRATVAGVQLQG